MAQWIKTEFGSIALLSNHDPFPKTDQALIEPNGLIAISKTLEAKKIIEAYKQGIFPWFNEHEPILWWSPDPRLILFPEDLIISSSLSKKIRKNNYRFLIDNDLETPPSVLVDYYNEIIIDKNLDVVYGYQEARKGNFIEFG